MSAEGVTLIAAVIAACASILSLTLQAYQKRGEEIRAATKLAAAKNLDEVGRLIHETIALSYIQSMSNSDQSHKDKYKDASSAANRLKDKRLDVRYSLWGIDEGLRTLSRLPDWVGHARVDQDRRTELLTNASKLGEALDDAIRHTYLTGTLPSYWVKWRVKRWSRRLRIAYDQFSKQRI